jgi:hypothetical protein
LLRKVRVLATVGKTGDAVTRMREYESAYGDKSNSPEFVMSLNSICWYGTLIGEAEVVAPFGDKLITAVLSIKLPPNLMADYRDTYAVNLAVRGKYAEAIKEFRAYLVVAKNRNPLPEAAIAKREEWVNQLEMGNNPFTSEVLKALKNE